NTSSLSHAEQIQTFAPAKFKNVADEVGLSHTYQVASQAVPYRFALYQSLGGGIAALDYDLDGVIDIHLAQGNGEPPSMVGELSNILYRNVDGCLVNVTESAGVQDTRYSVGLTAGDWNQDGFSDLVVANIGNKVLLINNGDGTFQRQVFDQDTEHKILTSSVAMGDLTGDSLPDLFSLRYVEDIEMLDRPKMNEQGDVLTVSPSSFQPGIDSIAVNDGSGNMLHQNVSDSSDDASTGLGVVIADWDGKPGNEIFVGNDIRANQLWRRSPDNNNWIDIAAVSGCALGVGAIETASMGIAVADFDGNGQRDIHITNFYQEPVSLFMNRGGIFQDRCVQYRLHRDSATVLGFGCQALDYNLDGRPDLAVTNGNIEKAPGEPLEQSPQLFVNLGDQFKLLDVEDSSAYWQGEYLGRGMAKLDFNLDGKQDLLITHLGSPTALMENQTETDHHWLSVQLVGVDSERDAIGAQVDVYAGEQSWTNWIVGGDGYLCRNEPVVFFGLADTTSVDRVVVTWPNGQQQTYPEIPIDRRILLIQNDPQAFLHPASPLAK
ncbi:MAG: CRTAC1 family protein, partial [Planctomycetota bacterium]|nr:CRTAC1 family protein [Planctomycetota bacterium]